MTLRVQTINGSINNYNKSLIILNTLLMNRLFTVLHSFTKNVTEAVLRNLNIVATNLDEGNF